jgi:bacteriorhodopsin
LFSLSQLTFILSTVLAMSYYAMWTGVGVTFKTTDTTPRVIFWGRYIGHLIAMPLVMADLSLVYKLDTGSMLQLISYDIIMYLAGFVGAYSVSFCMHTCLWSMV